MIDIRTATLEDFANFKLHHTNIEEIKLISGIEFNQCIPVLQEISKDNTIIFLDNKPLCMFGFIPNLGYANMWFLFDEDIIYLTLSFFKETRRIFTNMLNKYGTIEGHIYHKNYFVLKWAKFMGITVEQAEPYGIKGELFHKYYMRKGN